MTRKTSIQTTDRFRTSLRLQNIYSKIKSGYFSVIPKGSKAYQFTRGIFGVFLKRIHFFNIYYQEWIKQVDSFTDEDLHAIKNKIFMMEQTPFISIVMPVYNTPKGLLEEAIQSVIDQFYPYWELCIADDASTDPSIKLIINQFIEKDQRIRAVFRAENGHISEASNSALKIASHPFTALLDHDDILHPLALYYVAKVINTHPDVKIIYSDEDKITKNKRRIDPYFKSDFNYHLFLGHNMISHFGVYHTDTLREIGGFRKGLEGSQDYDLALRVLEKISVDQIYHIPYPLYHWRMTQQSAAKDLNVKPYAINAGEQAISEHLSRTGKDATVKFVPQLSAYQTQYTLPKIYPSVAILIQALDISDQLIQCIDAIVNKTEYPNYAIKICLPQSKDEKFKVSRFGTSKRVEAFFLPDDIFCSAAKVFNLTINKITADYVTFLDQSLLSYPPDWLDTMVSHGIQKDIGVCAPKLLFNNDIVFSCGVTTSNTGAIYHLFNGINRDDDGYFGWAKLTRECLAVSDKCLLIDRGLFNSVSGFSENYNTLQYSVLDLCLNMRLKQKKTLIIPSIELVRHDKFNYNLIPEYPLDSLEVDQKRFEDHWSAIIKNDPTFNPNLEVIYGGNLTVNLNPKYSFPGRYFDEDNEK